MNKLFLKMNNKKRFRSILSLVLVAALVIGAVNFGSIEAKADTSNPSIVTFEQDGITGSKSVVNNFDGTVDINFSINGASTTTPTQKVTDTNIVFVMDISGSMAMGSQRLTKAKEAAMIFVNKILTDTNKEHVKIGVASFSNYGYENQDLTNVASDVNKAIDSLTVKNGTNIQAGIQAAERILARDMRSNVNKIIILLSDGEPTLSYQATAVDTDSTVLTYGPSIKLLTSFNTNLVGDRMSYDINRYIAGRIDVTRTRTSGNWIWKDSSGTEYDKDDVVKVSQNIGYVYITVTNNGYPTISESFIAKKQGITIYSIAYDTPDNNNAIYTMKNVASTLEKYYEASSKAPASDASSNAIANIMATITKEVNESIAAARGAQIIDQLPSYLIAKAVTPSTGTTAVIDSNQQVTWTIGELPVGVTKTLTIKADLNKAEMLRVNNMTTVDLKDGAWFDMNKEATLTYTKPDNKLGNCPIGNPQLQFTTKQYSIDYYEDGNYITSGTNYQFAGENVSFGNLAAYSSDTEKYNKDLTTAKIGENSVLGEDGNWSFSMPDSIVIVRVDYFKNVFKVAYYDRASADNDGNGVRLEQLVKYGENAIEPSRDGLSAKKTAYQDSVTVGGNNGYDWTFMTWSNDGTNITADRDIYANYDSDSLKTYTVRFWANMGDTATLSTTNVQHGNTVSSPLKTPVYNTALGLGTGVERKEFAVWDFNFNTPITGDTDIYATYTDVMKTFTVQFEGLDGNILTDLSQSVEYNKTATDPSYSETYKTGTEIRTYQGWNFDFSTPITADRTIEPNYTWIPQFYTVTWDPANGVDPKETKSVEYGAGASYGKAEPTKQGDAQYTYTFDGWSLNGNNIGKTGDVTNVTSDMTLTANYTPTIKQYSYHFVYKDENNNQVTTDPKTVNYGSKPEEPSYPSIIVVSGSGIESTYTFSGWDHDVTKLITQDTVFTAEYGDPSVKYDVTFVYANGQTTIQVPAGTIIKSADIPSGDTLNKDADLYKKYTFDDWDNDIATPINGTTTFTAKYNGEDIYRSINVEVYLDGTIYEGAVASLSGVYQETVSGTYDAITNGLTVNGKKYEFKEFGADARLSVDRSTFTYTVGEVNGPIKIYFTEETKYKVTYFKVNMVPVSEESLEMKAELTTTVINTSAEVYAGGNLTTDWTYDWTDDAAKFTNAKYTYEFDGWVNQDGTPFTDETVTANKNVYASFKPVLRAYTVTFMDYKDQPDAETFNYYPILVNGQKSQTVLYGESATIPVISFRDNTEKWVYGDTSWDITQINPIKGDLTVHAQHPAELQQYEILFVDWNDKEIEPKDMQYGSSVSAPTDPTRANSEDGHFNYTFEKWVLVDDGETTIDKVNFPVTVSGAAIYKAVYTEKENTFTVTFLDEGNRNFKDDCQVVVTWGQKVGEAKDIARTLADAVAKQKSDDDKFYDYVFGGWMMNVDGNLVSAADVLEGEVKSNIIVYASYNVATKDSYTVTYHYEDGSQFDGQDVVSATDSYTVRTNGPAKDSTNTLVYTFVGWVYDKELEKGEFENVPADTYNENETLKTIGISGNVDLYPVYEESTRLYKVDFVDYDGRSLRETQHVEFDKPATAPTNPSRSDVYTSTTRTVYTFNGWDVDFSKIKADTTVTARYNTVVYDITPSTPVTPTTPPTVAPTPVVEDTEDIDDITEDIPQGTPEIPQGTPEVDNEDDSLPAEDTDDEVLDIDGNVIPQGTPELPQTGTAPVGIFYGIGIACAFIGASIIISSRKKREEEC